MRFRVIGCIAVLFAVAGNAAEAPVLSAMDVAHLDASLDSQPLDEWLVGQLGDDWEISQSQELNDCGEQDGTGTQRDFPLCTAIKFERAGKVGHLYISVGTQQKGVSGNPRFFFGVLDGVFINKLAELKGAGSL